MFYLALSPVQVSLDLVSEHPENAEIFFTEDGIYRADQSVRFKIAGNLAVRRYHLELPVYTNIKKLRFDFLEREGRVRLSNIKVSTSFAEIVIGQGDLKSALKPLNQVEITAPVDGSVNIISTGGDPYLEIDLSDATNAKFTLPEAGILLLAVMTGLAAIVLAGLIRQRLQIVDDRPGDWTVKMIFTVFLLLFLGIVAGKLHRSSIDMWNVYLPQQDNVSSVLFGHALPIRSDEWVVQTPWILNQWWNGSDSQSTTMGPVGSALLTAVPVNHISLLGQPKFWGGVFLPIEYAFSWFWAYKLVGLFAALFALFYTLTRSVFYSGAGALWIYGASFSQWWFSSNLPEIMIGFAGSVAATVLLMRARSATHIMGYAALVAILGLSTALHLYPPFIIPLFYLGIFLLVGAGLSSNREELGSYMAVKMISLGVATFFVALVGWLTFKDASTAIDLVNGTVYPGQRLSVGGDFDPMRLIISLFEFWRISGDSFPVGLVNASEASHFVSIWPFVLILAVVLDKKILREQLVMAVSTYCLILSIYLVYGFSPGIAEMTGFSLSPGPRAFVGLGVGGIILCILVAQYFWQKQLSHGPKVVITTFILMVFLMFGLGVVVSLSGDPFYTPVRLGASAICLSMLVCAILFHQRGITGLTVLAISLPGLIVNPVAAGLSPLTGKDLFIEAEWLQSTTDSPRWAVFGHALVSQAFVANGFSTFAGQQYIPTPAVMAILDPDSSAEQIWNRYARIELVAGDADRASFKLIYPDHYQIKISPCSTAMDALGVTHIASSTPLKSTCLVSTNAIPVNGIYLYSRQ